MQYINENVVVDGNIVTAKAIGYVDLAIELGKMYNVFKDERDLEETVEYYRNFRDTTQ